MDSYFRIYYYNKNKTLKNNKGTRNDRKEKRGWGLAEPLMLFLNASVSDKSSWNQHIPLAKTLSFRNTLNLPKVPGKSNKGQSCSQFGQSFHSKCLHAADYVIVSLDYLSRMPFRQICRFINGTCFSISVGTKRPGNVAI